MHVVDIQTTLGVATSQFATDLARVQSEVQGIHTTMQHALQVVGAAMDGHETTLGEQTDSMSTAMRAQSAEWTAQIHRLQPLVATQTKHIQQVLQGLEEATQQLTADLSTQLCHTSKHMETASQAQVERLDAIKESVARALADHAAAASADKDRVVAALTSTQVDLQNQVQIIQQLVQVQLDACVSTVSQSLANQRTAVQSQHDDAVSRLQSITTSVDSAVTALSEGTISQGTALQCHVDATSALVDGFARLEMVAAAADGHVVSCVNEVQRQLHEVAELNQTLQSDAASTPLLLPQDSFPTFQVQAMASTGVKRKSDDKDTTGGVASRLQPPKKYAKSNCDTVVSA
ncbi:hypothetical protein DYB35_007236 [Aphanomyces astaci]|nr:hypothetical protein DYB35_007236 [Aphanomyces astaci]